MKKRKKPHPSSGAPTPNVWDKADMENGMLTDELALGALPRMGGEGVSSRLTTIGTLGLPKVYKKPPSKFK